MMSTRPESFPALLADRRVIVVVRHADDASAEAIARAAAGGGLRAIEITMTVPGAARLIARLRTALEADVLVGAGTVLSAQQLDAVIAAGAQFVVAPGLSRPVLDGCAAAHVPFLPGTLTPTEVMACSALGLDAVKLFPSDSGGPAHLRALRSVFPHVAFVPTGGVTRSNAAGWLAAGAHALGLAGEFAAAHRDGGEERVIALARELRDACEISNGVRPGGGAPRLGDEDRCATETH